MMFISYNNQCTIKYKKKADDKFLSSAMNLDHKI